MQWGFHMFWGVRWFLFWSSCVFSTARMWFRMFERRGEGASAIFFGQGLVVWWERDIVGYTYPSILCVNERFFV